MRRSDPKAAEYWEKALREIVLKAAGGEYRLREAERVLTTGQGSLKVREARRVIRKVWNARAHIPRIEYFVPDWEIGIRSVRVLPHEPIEDVIGWYRELYGAYP